MEDWKIIEEYPNYMVSSEGKVKSIKRNDSRGCHRKGKILSPRYNTRGYISVVLYKNGEPQTFRVNRLVAQVFIPNPDNKPYVDHINGDRADNRVCNLRWVTHKENMNNPLTRLKLKNGIGQKIATECSRLKTSKPVLQFSKNGDFIRKWDSASVAERDGNFNDTSIGNCCKGKFKTSGGYIWRYADEYERIPFKVFNLEIYRRKEN